MKVLLIGVGGVGESIAVIAQKRSWLAQMVLADYNLKRAQEVQARFGDLARFHHPPGYTWGASRGGVVTSHQSHDITAGAESRRTRTAVLCSRRSCACPDSSCLRR